MAARHLLSSHLGALVAASTAGLRQQSSGMYTHIDRLAEAACSLAYVELGRRQLHTPSLLQLPVVFLLRPRSLLQHYHYIPVHSVPQPHFSRPITKFLVSHEVRLTRKLRKHIIN